MPDENDTNSKTGPEKPAPATLQEAAIKHSPPNTAPTDIIAPEVLAAEAAATPKAEGVQAQTGLDYGPGVVTLKSRSFHGNQEVSQRIYLSEPRTEDYLYDVLIHYHPSASREDFEVDPENKTNPDLKTDKE